MKEMINLHKQKEIINQKISDRKRKLHDELVTRRKKIFMMLDIAVIFIVLFNFGAIVLTRASVTKEIYEAGEREGREVVSYELNPVTAKEQNVKLHPDYLEIINVGGIWFLKWLVLISLYVFFRRNIYYERQITNLIIVIAIYFIMLGMDMLHNVGNVIGKILAGG